MWCSKLRFFIQPISINPSSLCVCFKSFWTNPMMAEPHWKQSASPPPHEGHFKHGVLIKPFMKAVFWFASTQKGLFILKWTCLSKETASHPLQKHIRGVGWVQLPLADRPDHRKEVQWVLSLDDTGAKTPHTLWWWTPTRQITWKHLLATSKLTSYRRLESSSTVSLPLRPPGNCKGFNQGVIDDF